MPGAFRVRSTNTQDATITTEVVQKREAVEFTLQTKSGGVLDDKFFLINNP